MSSVGSILGGVATLIVAIGIVAVLFKAGGLITALSVALGPRKEDKA